MTGTASESATSGSARTRAHPRGGRRARHPRRGGRRRPWDHEAFADCVTFIRLFADACHHGKEEDSSFPSSSGQGMPRHQGPIAVMLHEHQQGRAFARHMADALEGARAGDPQAQATLRNTAAGYVNLIRGHIHRKTTSSSTWPTRRAGSDLPLAVRGLRPCAPGASRATARSSCRSWGGGSANAPSGPSPTPVACRCHDGRNLNAGTRLPRLDEPGLLRQPEHLSLRESTAIQLARAAGRSRWTGELLRVTMSVIEIRRPAGARGTVPGSPCACGTRGCVSTRKTTAAPPLPSCAGGPAPEGCLVTWRSPVDESVRGHYGTRESVTGMGQRRMRRGRGVGAGSGDDRPVGDRP